MKKYILLFLTTLFWTGAALAAVGDNQSEEFLQINNATVENVRVSYNFKTTKTLKIYNLLGKSVAIVRLPAGNNSLDLSSSLDRGTYVYSVEGANKSYSAKKFIVK